MEGLVLLLILALIGYAVVSVLGGMLSPKRSSDRSGSGGIPLKKILLGIIKPNALERNEGAEWLEGNKRGRILNSRNKGLLVDGKNQRITPQQSFAHCLVVAPTGGGKTTRYVMPNLLTLDDCSFVVTDPSGELYQQVAGSLSKRGFDVLRLEPANPSASLCYNPLANISDYTQIMEMASTIVRSSNPEAAQGESSFWYDGAADLLSVLIRCLGVAGDDYLNLGNLLYVLQNFSGDGRGLASFLERYADDSALHQFQGIVLGNERTVSSFVSTAVNSLQMLNNPDMAALMSRNDINFRDLRRRKTALFLNIPSERIHHYRFIMNLFYVDLFGSLASELPGSIRGRGETCLPVYCLMDEFGHTSIPNFSTIATTIRKYEVSLSIILQNFAQLGRAYGDREALTIIDGGMNSRIFYPGLPHSTAQNVEQILGKEIIRQVRWDGSTERKEQNLLNADRIRTLADDKAIFVTGNKEAVLLDTLPSFRSPRFKRMLASSKPAGIEPRTELPNFKRVPL